LIFVTVGTHHQPFDRLLSALSGLDPDLIVQYGTGRPPEGAREAVDYMPFERVLECLEEAEKVITHAGVGSILLAIRSGHRPLVVPRRADLGEHVDDHQSELTRALGESGAVLPVWEVAELGALLAAAPARGEVPAPPGREEFAERVGDALRGDQASER
jgi:UDP-N-acetylglucosamine--N-acetylmuramyl-(pentapeptide) pyrophosphoryl-undecaprenol N-acetylglucosamine transferase